MNGDGMVNVADPVYLLQHIFLGGPAPEPCARCWYGDLRRGDANSDGRMNVADAVAVLMFLFLDGESPGPCASCYPCEPAKLPATGASHCWNPDTGEEIPCDDEEWPGQDGFYRAGCPLEGRFVDEGNGTVSDRCTGLMWQQERPFPAGAYEPDEFGRISWQMALHYCESLELGGYDDWRLPNEMELAMLTVGWSKLAPEIGLDEVFNETLPPDPLEVIRYWTSSARQCRLSDVSCVFFRNAGVAELGCRPGRDKNFVRAVRGGLEGPCASRLPATGVHTCRIPPEMDVAPCDSEDFPGQDGAYMAGMPVAGRSFDNGDGTVTDLATGLMWVRDTASPSLEYDPDGDRKVYWQKALQYCDRLKFAGYEDWRLPNVVEMLSIMTDYDWADPIESGPIRLERSGYWSSTSACPLHAYAWVVGRCFGTAKNGAASGDMAWYVLPVRAGL